MGDIAGHRCGVMAGVSARRLEPGNGRDNVMGPATSIVLRVCCYLGGSVFALDAGPATLWFSLAAVHGC